MSENAEIIDFVKEARRRAVARQERETETAQTQPPEKGSQRFGESEDGLVEQLQALTKDGKAA